VASSGRDKLSGQRQATTRDSNGSDPNPGLTGPADPRSVHSGTSGSREGAEPFFPRKLVCFFSICGVDGRQYPDNLWLVVSCYPSYFAVIFDAQIWEQTGKKTAMKKEYNEADMHLRKVAWILHGVYFADRKTGRNVTLTSLKSLTLPYVESYPNPNNIKCKYQNLNLDPPVA